MSLRALLQRVSLAALVVTGLGQPSEAQWSSVVYGDGDAGLSVRIDAGAQNLGATVQYRGGPSARTDGRLAVQPRVQVGGAVRPGPGRRVWVPRRTTWIRVRGILRPCVTGGYYRWIPSPPRCDRRVAPLPSPGGRNARYTRVRV